MSTTPRNGRLRRLLHNPALQVACIFVVGLPVGIYANARNQDSEHAAALERAGRTVVECSDHALSVVAGTERRTILRRAITGVTERRDPKQVSVHSAGGKTLVLDFPTAGNIAAVRRCTRPAPA